MTEQRGKSDSMWKSRRQERMKNAGRTAESSPPLLRSENWPGRGGLGRKSTEGNRMTEAVGKKTWSRRRTDEGLQEEYQEGGNDV